MLQAAVIEPTPLLEGLTRSVNEKYTPLGYHWDKVHNHWGINLADGVAITYDLSALDHFRRDHPALAQIWDVCKQHPYLENAGIYKAYISCHTYGTDGTTHRDTSPLTWIHGNEAAAQTIVVYLNEQWDSSWAGETVLLNDSGDVIQSVSPKLGRVFMFPPLTLHGPRPLARSCNELRQVLVFKTMDTKYNDPAVDYVKGILKDQLLHGMDAFEYSYSVSMALAKLGAPLDLIRAGLFVGCYEQSIDWDGIDDIIGMIGIRSENALYSHFAGDPATSLEAIYLQIALLSTQPGNNIEKLEELHRQLSYIRKRV